MVVDRPWSRRLANPASIKLSLLLIFPGGLAAGATDGASLMLLLVPGGVLAWTGINWLRDPAAWETFVRLTEVRRVRSRGRCRRAAARTARREVGQ